MKSKKQREQKQRELDSYLKQLEVTRNGLIKDRYPNVMSITFQMNYKDPDGLASPSYKEKSFKEDDSAYFNFNCPYRECIKGGHDLNSVVSGILQDNINEYTRNSTCQGWQDRERINKHRCLGELNYKIIVKYKEEPKEIL